MVVRLRLPDAGPPFRATVSPLAEMCAGLHVLVAPGHHPGSRHWVALAHEKSYSSLLAQTLNWAPLWDAFRAQFLYPLNWKSSPRAGITRNLEALSRLPIAEFQDMVADALYVGALKGGRRPDDQRLLGEMSLISARHHNLAAQMLRDPEQLLQEIVMFLDDFYHRLFEREWVTIHGIVTREASAMTGALRNDPLAAVQALPLVIVGPGKNVIRIDKLYTEASAPTTGPILLIPTVLGHPHLVVKHGPGRPSLIHYPARDRSAETLSTVEDVSARLASLNNITRLTICRLLLRQPASTNAIARYLDRTPSEVSRQLSQLRAAGLVATVRTRNGVLHHLNTAVLESLGEDILASIQG
ncbi:ArsR/SmtB family transcription factor [Actinacidiphila oryziradicis]|uniref:Winged helix-turn-helix transcriptional regulator n=1 Tax=Actinacidiphila oryziradicis TaxID=2571141 RepID=A0A4U0SGB9_9ACTN|nr:DUF5937 family protein [Actinacidiphila oryziradicis]TKA08492.1 winged helix-turn-helix transcriptional regulator [Actinacidiphila oryziradicis]